MSAFDKLIPLVNNQKFWTVLSLNPTINFNLVLNNLDKPWDWVSLSRNKDATLLVKMQVIRK